MAPYFGEDRITEIRKVMAFIESLFTLAISNRAGGSPVGMKEIPTSQNTTEQTQTNEQAQFLSTLNQFKA